MTRARFRIVVTSLVVAAGCGGGGSADDGDETEGSESGGPTDGGPTDGGPTDGGPTDDGPVDSSEDDATSSSATDDTTSTDDDGTGTTDDGTGTTDDGTTDDGTTDDGTTGETGVLPSGCEAECAAGCTSELLLGLSGTVSVDHDGTTILGRSSSGRAGLWRASDLALVSAASGVDRASLAGGIAAFEIDADLEIRDADDGTVLGTIAADDTWGLADDGSYVWTAGAGGLSSFTTAGAESWTLAGDFTDAIVLALPTGVHAFAPATSTVVHHVDAASGDDTEVAFAGDFGGWFADAPRFWSTTGDTFRLYEPDGMQLAFEFGDPAYGWGDRLLLWDDFHLDATIVDVSAADTPIGMIAEPRFSGPAVIGLDPMTFSDVVLLQLDDPALALDPITPGCCVSGLSGDPYDFAWSGGSWVLGGSAGELFDHEGSAVTPGELLDAYGAVAGRFVVATSLDRTHVFDVDDDCVVAAGGSFARPSVPAVLADDGVILMSPEKPFGGGYFGQLWTRFYDTSTGVMLGEFGPQLSSSYWTGGQISASGGLFSSAPVSNEFFDSFIATQPGFEGWDAGNWAQVPAIAPDGVHAAYCDASPTIFATFEGAQSYVLDEDGPVSVLDGVAWGFLANDRVLVGHYLTNNMNCYYPGECDTFVSSDVVDLDGNIVTATTLPQTRFFERVSDTEIFTTDTLQIWDVYTGAMLWEAPAEADAAAPVGSDFVAMTDGAVLTLTKWR